MISYELMVLLRTMPKPEVVSTLKRAAGVIYSNGGIIRKLENLGTRDMPYKTSNHGACYREASYYLFEFNAPPSLLRNMLDEYGRDVDIIRRRIYKKTEPKNYECTLNEELLPPPYRKNVQDLITKAKKLDKPKFNYNTGLDYYPFQK